MVVLKEITVENFREVITLKVKRIQKKFVADNAASIAQSKIQPEYIPLAIYNDNTLIGFLMYSIDKEYNSYSIDRLMIDKKYQGKGYGKKALEIIINEMKKDKKYNRILLGVEKENESAKELYKRFGFIYYGEMDGDEEIMELQY